MSDLTRFVILSNPNLRSMIPSHRGIGFHSPNADLIKSKHVKTVLEDHVQCFNDVAFPMNSRRVIEHDAHLTDLELTFSVSDFAPHNPGWRGVGTRSRCRRWLRQWS